MVLKNAVLIEVQLSDINIPTAPPSELQQESLILQGQLQPIYLREVDPEENDGFKYDVVDGRRRLVDLIATGKRSVMAFVYKKDSVSNSDLHLQALTLNSGKPNYMDEADHVAYLVEIEEYEVGELAAATNLSESTILNRLDLSKKLHPLYQECLRSGLIKVSSAYELVKISNLNDICRAPAGALQISLFVL